MPSAIHQSLILSPQYLSVIVLANDNEKFRHVSIDMTEQNSGINMNISNNDHPNIFDLPNEILFIIINKLNIDDLFYSLVDINERFAQLVLDPLYIQNLDIT